MKKIFTLFALTTACMAHSQDGILDVTFGGSGFISVPPPTGIAIDNRNKIVVAGNKIYQCFAEADNLSDDADFALARYNADGTIDNSFGPNANGFVRTDFGGEDIPFSLVVLPDNSIVVVGSSTGGSPAISTIALWRVDASGNPVVGFGTAGRVLPAIGYDAIGTSIIREAAGTLAIAGYGRSSVSASYDILTARINATTGALVTGYNGTGFRFTDVASFTDQAFAIRQQADGRLVVAGSAETASGINAFSIARFNSNGTPDNSFDGDGLVTVSFNGTDDRAFGLDFAPTTGNIVVGGYTLAGGHYDYAIARLTTAGALDAGFNTTGRVTANVGTRTNTTTLSNDIGQDILVQADGKVLIAGYLSPNSDSTGDDDYAIMRFLTNGAIDNSFGPNNNGRSLLLFTGVDRGYSLALQNAQILIGGISGAAISIARLNNIPSTPLPVNLLTFQAVRQNSQVKVLWETSAEYNAERFEVERSRDGNQFQAIGSTSAAGNSTVLNRYQFTDQQPAPGMNYYRLRVINNDGSFQFSRVIPIRFDQVLALQVYPNPVKSTLHVQVRADAGDLRLRLFDATGRLVKEQQIAAAGGVIVVPVDVSRLQRGVYVLQVNDEHVRIVKE